MYNYYASRTFSKIKTWWDSDTFYPIEKTWETTRRIDDVLVKKIIARVNGYDYFTDRLENRREYRLNQLKSIL